MGQESCENTLFYEDMKNWIKSYRLEIIIFLAALILRLALFAVNFSANDHAFIPTIKGDDGYYELSQNIIAGNGFSFDAAPPYRPNPLRPPVWPLLIAFFAKTFGSYWAVFMFEMILGCFIPILGMHVARRIVGDKLSKWVAAALVFEPYSILLSFILYTETAFTFFFLVFLVFLFRYIENQNLRNAIWSGIFLGIACLVKPTVQFFPILIPIALAIIWRKHLVKDHARHVVVFLIGFALMLAPWLYRNHQEFGVWGISAQPAFNLYVYLVPTVLAIDNGTDFGTELALFVNKDGFDVNSINLSNSDYYKAEAMKVIKDHKVALLKSAVISGITFFTHDGMLTVLGYADIRIPNIVTKPIITLIAHPTELLRVISYYVQSPAIIVLIMRMLWYLITILFIVGAWLIIKREGARAPVLAALLMVLYFAATTCINGLGVNARFKVPVNVFIFSFAAYGLISLSYTILGKLKR